MCARFTVLSDTPIAAAIAGCVIPLSRNSTIWMRWRCGADIFHRNAVFSRRTSALLHLTICFPRIRWRKRITPRGRKTLAKPPDSSRYGGGISMSRLMTDDGDDFSSKLRQAFRELEPPAEGD